MDKELFTRIEYCLKFVALPNVARETIELCKAALSQEAEPVACRLLQKLDGGYWHAMEWAYVKPAQDVLQAVAASPDRWRIQIAYEHIPKPAPLPQPVGWTNDAQLECLRSDGEAAIFADDEDCPIPVFLNPQFPDSASFDRMVSPLIRAVAKNGPQDVLDEIDNLRAKQPVASVPQDVEEFIAGHTIKIEIFHEPTIVCKPDDLRAWMAGHARVPVDTQKDAERYAWLKSHIGEQRTQRSLMNEFSENKTEYVFPRLIAWADFCGQITLDEAIDLKIAAIAEKQAIIDNKEQKE